MAKISDSHYISKQSFNQQFIRLIVLAWLLPAFVGLLFILFINVLSVEQLTGILLTPTEPAFILVWTIFAVWYFRKYSLPISELLAAPVENKVEKESAALECMQNFPIRFWLLFLCYLLLAPASVILSAEFFTDYVAQPVDWFRIHLIALIVSIIVGLPIFFKVLDLFGKSLHGIQINKAHITIKTKVFMIGALVPLLIDTMLVQYFWTRTGFFTGETFFVWLFLELLAIAGSLIFTRSFGQSLIPLQKISSMNKQGLASFPETLYPVSTDELGVLTSNYRSLLDSLFKHQNKLEALVAERTSELEKSNKDLEAFNTAIAHDLRTPITAISGYCQLLSEELAGKLDGSADEYLTFIKSTADDMAVLIEDLLNLSRVTKAEIEKEDINVSLMAKELSYKFKHINADRVVDVEIEENLSCYADRGSVIIVLENLLNNAWKYTGKTKDAKIHVGKFSSDEGSCFYVKDNGAGFDMKKIDKLFNVFQRLHSGSEFSGTGVGLATVQRVVKKHEGSIWAEAELNKGATFFICFPEP